MDDQLWKPLLGAIRKSFLIDLYRRLRHLDYTQVDRRTAVLLKILLLISSVGGGESAMVAVLMLGHTSEGISNRDQSRWLSLSHNGGLRGLGLACHLRLSILREYVSGKLTLSNKPLPKLDPHQQIEIEYPDKTGLKRELEKLIVERDQVQARKEFKYGKAIKMVTWSKMSRTKVTEPVNPEMVPSTEKTHPIRVSRVAKYRKTVQVCYKQHNINNWSSEQ